MGQKTLQIRGWDPHSGHIERIVIQFSRRYRQISVMQDVRDLERIEQTADSGAHCNLSPGMESPGECELI